MSDDPVLDFLEELEIVINHLKKNWPDHGVRHPNGDYGWDKVAYWSQKISEADMARERDIREYALKIIQERHKEMRGY